MIDACQGLDRKDDVYKMLKENFDRHYLSTKAPFPMFTHAAWFLKKQFYLGGMYYYVLKILLFL